MAGTESVVHGMDKGVAQAEISEVMVEAGVVEDFAEGTGAAGAVREAESMLEEGAAGVVAASVEKGLVVLATNGDAKGV